MKKIKIPEVRQEKLSPIAIRRQQRIEVIQFALEAYRIKHLKEYEKLYLEYKSIERSMKVWTYRTVCKKVGVKVPKAGDITAEQLEFGFYWQKIFHCSFDLIPDVQTSFKLRIPPSYKQMFERGRQLYEKGFYIDPENWTPSKSGLVRSLLGNNIGLCDALAEAIEEVLNEAENG